MVSGPKQPPTEIGGDRPTATSAPTLRRLVHLLARQSAREAIGDAVTADSPAVRDTLRHDEPNDD